MTRPIYNAIHTETTKQIIQKFKKKKEWHVRAVSKWFAFIASKKNQQQTKIDN